MYAWLFARSARMIRHYNGEGVRDQRCKQNTGLKDPRMIADLKSLATTLYVTIDDAIQGHPEWVPYRPKIGITPKLSYAELLALAVLQALVGIRSQVRPLRSHPSDPLVPLPPATIRLQQTAQKSRDTHPTRHGHAATQLRNVPRRRLAC